jgi:tetratricopeptide (TPR) repeat protein
MNGKKLQALVLYFICLIVFGCAAGAPAPSKHSPRSTSDTKVEKKELREGKPRPREVASLHLTEQGQMLLESGKVDEAIGVLERAVNIYPSNGKNYYYLAEAWLRKGNVIQAREWNRLAGMYLAGDSEWSPRVYEQRGRINVRSR